MIHAGSHDDLALSSRSDQDRKFGLADALKSPEPLSARDVYRVIMLQVAKERPELELEL